jgi:pilus assembly protein CpaD
MELTKKLARLVPLGFAVLMSGCANYEAIPQGVYVPVAHYERFPIGVTQVSARIDLPAHGPLTVNEQNDVTLFAQDYLSAGNGPITIARPVGGRNAQAATQTASAAGRLIAAEGIPAQAIQHQTYRAPRGEAAPVIIAYSRVAAMSPDCGNWSVDIAQNYSNMPAPNFGCAQQANIAAMVANPQDLVTPRASTPSDTMRRNKMFNDYRNARPTATERTDQEKGTASEVSP